jgi:hypothetical protein
VAADIGGEVAAESRVHEPDEPPPSGKDNLRNSNPGNRERKLAPGAAAACEAYEEAWVEGQIRPRRPIGAYHYAKNLEAGELPMKVKVFLLWVERQLANWPEQAERETRWFSIEVAAGLVAEPELAAILLRTPDIVARKKR